jgi:hypothetical protein
VVTNPNSHLLKVEEDTSSRIINANPTVIKEATSLPDFVHNGGQENGGMGRTIVVNQKPNNNGATSKVHATSA